jgi:hypothetical protein
MASILKIKRSTGNGPPSGLASGELAYAWDELGGFANGKMYIGTGSETLGVAANIETIGGKYFTNLLDHTLGTLQPSSALLTDSNSKLDQLKVDNLDFNGNTISSTNSNGDINITPSGSGKTVITNIYTDASTTLSAYIQGISGAALTFTEGEAIDIVRVGNTINISGELATSTNIGSASFSSTNFTVTNGAVTTNNITLGSSTLNNGTTTSTLLGLQQLSVDNLDFNAETISNTVTNGNIILAPNGTGTVSVSSKRIINVATPVNDNDAANKLYVDSARSGLDVKASVRAATTANITLSGTQTVDGITLEVGDRVLVKNQTTSSENGIYAVASSGWSRATDADNSPSGEVTSGMFTFVEEGTTNQNTGFVLTTTGTITLGVTALTFTVFSTSGTLIAGAGLIKSGDTLAVQAGNGIEVSADTVQLASTIAGAGLTLTSGVLAVVGTTNRIIANADSIDIASTYVGQSSITTLGTVTTGVWNGTTVAVGYGGTGLTTATSNGILYGSGTMAFGVTAASTIDGSFLRGDASGAPYWSNIFDGGTY